MGCYNGTCNISNMPIFAGDKVVLIPVMKVCDTTVFNTCYTTDNFVPLGFPIVGYYNDYGGIENIEVSDINRDYFLSLSFYFNDRENQDTYKEVKKYDNFEDFVNNVLCTVEGCYVDVADMDLIQSDLIKSGKANVNFMMIHYGLYEALMKNVKNRCPYGKSTNIESVLTMMFKIYIEQEVKTLNKWYPLISMDGRLINEKKIVLKQSMKTMSSNIFNKGDKFFEDRWEYFCNIALNEEDKREEVIKYAVDKYIFTLVLSLMRKGYLCDSGCGSQSEETKLHLIMADFIRNQVMKNAERYEDIAKIKGVEEPLFF